MPPFNPSDYINVGPSPFNNPFGAIGSPPPDDGNAANHGYAPAAGFSSGQPLVDMVVNALMKGMMGNSQMLRTFNRPNMSDYAYTAMQERRRASEAASPAILAMNPFLRSMGKLGEQPMAQQMMDAYASPGGSMNEAFNVIMGRFGNDLAGPGPQNAATAAVMSANVLKNIDKGLVDENGLFDYGKTAGFTRGEAFKNVSAFNRQFGGFGSYGAATGAEKVQQVAEVANEAVGRPGAVSSENQEKIAKAKENLAGARARLELGDMPVDDEGNGLDPALLQEVRQKRFDEAKKKLEEVQKSSEADMGPVRDEIRSLKDQISKGELKGPALAEADAKLQQAIKKYGTPSDQEQLKAAQEARSGPIGVAAQVETEQNAGAMKQVREQFTKINEMVREAQNLFGQDQGLGELMKSVEGLVEGTRGMSAGKAKEMLQKIQATAVTVDMSNESISRYFDMMKNLYKGMGVTGNTTDRAQAALLSGKATVDARKAKLAPGEMYTGPDATEEAQNIAKLTVDVENSAVNQHINAFVNAAKDGPDKDRVIALANQGKYEEALALVDKHNAGDKQDAYRTQAAQESIAKYGMTKGQREQNKKLGLEEVTPEQAQQRATDQYFASMEQKGTETSEAERDLGAEKTAKIRGVITSRGAEVLLDKNKFKEAAKAAGVSEADADKFWMAQNSDLNNPKNAAVRDMVEKDLLISDDKKAQMARTKETQSRVEEGHRLAAERAPYMRDLNLGDGAAALVSAKKKLQDMNIDTSKMSANDILKAAGAEFMSFVGAISPEDEKKARLVNGEYKDDIDKEFKKRQESSADDIAKLKKTWSEGVYKDKPKELEEAVARETENRKQKDMDAAVEAVTGIHQKTPEEAEKEARERQDFNPLDALGKIITELQNIAKAILGERQPADSGSTPATPTDPNPNLPAPQNTR